MTFPITGISILYIIAGITALVFYIAYLNFIVVRPWYLLYFPLVIWRLFVYWNYSYPNDFHVNIRISCLFLLGFPVLLLIIKHFKSLWHEFTCFKWFCLFETLCLFFLIFHSSSFINPLNTVYEHATASRMFVINYSYLFIAAVVGHLSCKLHPNPRLLFKQFNTVFIFYLTIETICTVLGYPFQLFSRNVDGFLRGEGFNEHPNALAFVSSFSFLYFFGLLNDYRTDKTNTYNEYSIPLLLIVIGLLSSGTSFLLALSKNAIACLFVVMLFYTSLLGIRFKQKKPITMLLFLFTFVLPVLFIIYYLLTGNSLTDLIEARVQDSSSFEWRLRVWQSLLNEIHTPSLILGHGLGSVDEYLYSFLSLEYLTKFAIFYPHNATIQVLYEMGLLGLTYYIPCIIYATKAFDLAIKKPKVQAFSLAGLTIVIYFLLAAQVDEMIVMFSTMLMWMILSFIQSYILFENQETK